MLTSTKGSRRLAVDQFVNSGTEIDNGAWQPTIGGLNGVSPDERWLGIYRSYTPHLYVYRLPGIERVAKLTSEARISLVEFSPHGDEVAISSRSGMRPSRRTGRAGRATARSAWCESNSPPPRQYVSANSSTSGWKGECEQRLRPAASAPWANARPPVAVSFPCSKGASRRRPNIAMALRDPARGLPVPSSPSAGRGQR